MSSGSGRRQSSQGDSDVPDDDRGLGGSPWLAEGPSGDPCGNGKHRDLLEACLQSFGGGFQNFVGQCSPYQEGARAKDGREGLWVDCGSAFPGLLRGSFIPPEPIRDLRDLTRYRKSLTDERVRQVQRLQKFLEGANIKLASVASNVMGVSGRAMLEALMAGSTDPQVLSELAKGRLRKKLPELKKALEGRFRSHHGFMVAEILTHLDFLDEAIERVSQGVSNRIFAFSRKVELMDLVPGINQRVAEGVLSEMGIDMNCFPSHRHAASWTGLCPGNNEGAGKRKSGKTRKGNPWLRRYLIEASWAAVQKRGTYLSALYYRLVPRRGKKKAIVAVAHAILVMIFHILKDQVPYRELGSDYFNKLNAAYVQRHHVKRLESLGFKVILEPLSEAA